MAEVRSLERELPRSGAAWRSETRTSRAVSRVILPCQNGYYDSDIEVLFIVVKESIRYH